MAIFYQEVVDAIARNPPDVGDLVVLRDLCSAVDAGDKPAASRLARDLTQLSGIEDPLHSISAELYDALRARILLLGWFDEFDLLMYWDQTHFGEKDQNVASNWDGILKIVKLKPQSLQLLRQLDHEKEWQRALNGLEGALRHMARVKLPPPPPPVIGPGYEGPARYETVLPEALGDATEQFFRVLQTLFQQMLESAVTRLERDSADALALRKLQALQTSLDAFLEGAPTNLPLPPERARRSLNKTVRVAEVRYGRGRATHHRFLDAFPRYESRSVVFHSLDREDKEPHVRGERLRHVVKTRTRQLAFYFDAYGHPPDPKESPSALHDRRRTLIKTKHGGRLKLAGNDDLVALLSNFFDEELTETLRQAGTNLTKAEVGVRAWHKTAALCERYLGQLTSHSRLNLTEGPPNYLTHQFPRNLGGRLFHDCGVYAVRMAYALLAVLDSINRLHPGLAGTIRARWVRLPLHVGVMIESSTFGLTVQHNDHLFPIDNDKLQEVRDEWLGRRGNDTDPADADALTLKFFEDVAASAFSSDLDMPIGSTLVLRTGEPVTTQSIWNSYQKKVVPSQLFTRLVGARNAPQYQFDKRYLELSEVEREWFNKDVRRFWNVECKGAWDRWREALIGASNRPAELIRHKLEYAEDLFESKNKLITSYEEEILPQKKRLSSDLRADNRLLLPGVRIVRAARIGTVLPAVTRVEDHIREMFDSGFRFRSDFVPPFARRDEELLEVP